MRYRRAGASAHGTGRFRYRGTTAIALTVAVTAGATPTPVLLAVPGLRFTSPVPDGAVPVTAFDPPDRPWQPGHRGVDLASTPLAPVRAPADAKVLFAGSVGGKPVVSLDHGSGLRTTYEPVSATVLAGEVVSAGQLVGHLVAGHPGCPVEACLHWGARVASGGSGGDDEYVDPLSLMHPADRPIRLKPVQPGDGRR